MASIHTMFATKMLQDVIDPSLFKEISAVLIIFGVVEIVFFLIHSFLLHAKVIRVYEWLNFINVFNRGKGYLLYPFPLHPTRRLGK